MDSNEFIGAVYRDTFPRVVLEVSVDVTEGLSGSDIYLAIEKRLRNLQLVTIVATEKIDHNTFSDINNVFGIVQNISSRDNIIDLIFIVAVMPKNRNLADILSKNKRYIDKFIITPHFVNVGSGIELLGFSIKMKSSKILDELATLTNLVSGEHNIGDKVVIFSGVYESPTYKTTVQIYEQVGIISEIFADYANVKLSNEDIISVPYSQMV